MKLNMTLTTAVLLGLCISPGAVPRSSGDEADSDWITILGAREAGAVEDSGIVGMTDEEAQSYAAEAMAELGADEEVPDVFIRGRRRLVLQEMKINSDWDCDPTAVPAMVNQYKVRTGLDAQALLPRKPLTFDMPEMLDWPIVYLTAHYAFTFSEAEEKGFQRYIKRGGFLYADDCLYGQTFGPAFQGEISRLFPDSEFAPIDRENPAQDMVYKQKYSFKNVHESGVPSAFMNANPFRGLFLDGRIAVLYSPQDIGCAWEISSPPTPSNPLGAGMHSSDLNPGGREAAYRLGVNIILYTMAH